MFDTLLKLSMFLLTVSIVIALYRVIKGPSLSDRILALDSIGYNVIGIVAVLSMLLNSHAYLETILLIGILAFLSTVALCKFLERGVVIERKRNH
ncbi:Na(+)/H(+) antiporter subunit F [Cohnella sp. CIP 111063]|jgi:multicomponent Na+:H+ antiporter subunit F|uniref:Na(+)/H(+) antiporter subunit F1 n=1 Tax=unclassified Cohnella TaxID=2636738 RepID=UPI000B8BE498|nr:MULTISPECIES: Na(+)/H(+) antiporter subunit F1 [unclassified Cohnella]OXS62505.1 Na(+)/H(+) antiporter subunit F [Cohnella sp. CIP 111063]PRX74750.1 multisubunit sodium/proton antiporter MrpF subunit [Cohnella sp. SGD-V74]